MRRPLFGWVRLIPLLALIGFVACGDEAKGPRWVCEGSDLLGCAPDFLLRDHNPASETYDTYVSPRDYLGTVAAFYFGSAA